MMLPKLRMGLLAVLLLAPSAFGQPPVAWWENPVANGLSLTDAQKDRINSIVADFRDRLAQERLDAERAERELEAIFNSERVDWERGRLAIDQVTRTRTAFMQDVSWMTLRLRAVLTSEQWRTLQARGVTGRGREGGKGPRPDSRGRPQQGSGPIR